jgi:hypothetical protein
MMAYFIALSGNLKSPQQTCGCGPMDFFAADASAYAGILNSAPKGFELFSLTFGHKLHSPVRQIADGSSHFKAQGQVPGGVPKTDSLNPTRIEDRHSKPVHSGASKLPQPQRLSLAQRLTCEPRVRG